MKINNANTSFQGVYVAKGTKEQVDDAEKKLKQRLKIEVINIPYKKNDEIRQLGIIATKNDAEIFAKSKKETDFKEMYSGLKGNVLAKCGYMTRILLDKSPDEVPLVSATKIQEMFNKNAVEYYFLEEGKTFCENTYLDGTKEKLTNFGKTVILTRPDGTIETIKKSGGNNEFIVERTVENPDGTKETTNYFSDGSCIVTPSFGEEYYLGLNGERYTDIRRNPEEGGKGFTYVLSDDKKKLKAYVKHSKALYRKDFEVDKDNNLMVYTPYKEYVLNPKLEKTFKNEDGSSFLQKDGTIKYINENVNKKIKGTKATLEYKAAVFEDNSYVAYDNNGKIIAKGDNIEKTEQSHMSKLFAQDGAIERSYIGSKVITRYLKDGTIEKYRAGKLLQRTNSKNANREEFLYLKDGGYFVDTMELVNRKDVKYFNENIKKEVKSIKQENLTRTVTFEDGSTVEYAPDDVIDTFLQNHEIFTNVKERSDAFYNTPVNGDIAEIYDTLGTKTVIGASKVARRYGIDGSKALIFPNGRIVECDSNWHYVNVKSSEAEKKQTIPKTRLSKKLETKVKKLKEDPTYKIRFERYKSAKTSLASTIAWELSDKTRANKSEIAKTKPYLNQIFEKEKEIRLTKDAALFEDIEPTEQIDLTEKERILYKAYQKESWAASGTDEISENMKIAIKAVQDYVLDGIFSIEDEKIRTIIAKWEKLNPQKKRDLFN